VVYGGAQTISNAAIVSYQNQPAHHVVIAGNPKPQLRFYTSLFVLALIQIILAALLVIFGLAAFFVGTSDYDYDYYNYDGNYDVDWSGVWVGALYIVACSLGLGSLRIRTGYRCLLVSYFVLLVIAIVLTPVVIGMSSFWISVGENQYDYYYYYSSNTPELALNSVLLIIGIVEMVLSVVSAAFLCCNWHCGECCHICCCGRKTHVVERTQLSTYPKY